MGGGNGGAQCGIEDGKIRDLVVGGKAADDGGRIVTGDEGGGQRDRRSGTPRRRLDQHVPLGQGWELAGHRCGVGRAADD